MTSQTSRNIIVAGSMAALIGTGVVIYALRSPPVAPVAVAQNLVPPTRAAESPAAPAVVAPIPEATPAVAPTPDAPAVIADNKSVVIKSAETAAPAAAEPKPARKTHLAKASASAAPLTTTTTTTPESSPTNEQKEGTSTQFAPSDSEITADVKSQIAGDGLSKDADIGVTTTDGVVALTGSLASQDAIDHVKDVVGKIKNVKSVDASALTLASL